MNSRLSEGNILRMAKRILGLAGLFALALICSGPTFAQKKPQVTDTTSAPSGATVPGTPPSVQASSGITPPDGATVKTTQSAGTQDPSAKPPAPRGQREGVTVHGHWTIEVRNPDGKVVTHREFENALNAQTGGPLLTALLLGQNSPGAWAVGVGPNTGVCNNPSQLVLSFTSTGTGALPICSLAVAGDQYFEACTDANGCFSTAPAGLTAPTAVLSPSGVATLTLSGQMTVEASGSIGDVTTMLMTCSTTVAPAACPTTPPPSPVTTAQFPPLLLQPLLQDLAPGFPVNEIARSFPFGIPLTFANFASLGAPCGGTNQPMCSVPVQAQQVVSVTVQLSFSSQ